MADVVVLPGVERRDIGAPVPNDEVLRYALENGVTDIIIIGRERSGRYYVSSAIGDTDKVVGRLMWAVHYLATSEIVQDNPDAS